MRDWLAREPIVIAEGEGAVLRDVHGREYLDANSSIWTNLHGHNHPKINSAIQRQLKKIAHSSALGLANEPASLLAKQLVEAANQFRFTIYDFDSKANRRVNRNRNPKLEKVFFSDDGSTALEVALKLAYEFTRRTRGRQVGRASSRAAQPKFLSLEGAYHGDTVGAVALGHIDLFHKAYSGLLFKTDKVMSPFCYRCPFNRARPERADAREYRKCNWECVGLVEQKFSAQKKKGDSYAAFVFEPVMQGAAGMIPQPETWLKQVSEIARGQRRIAHRGRSNDRIWPDRHRSSRRKEAHFKKEREVRASSRRLLPRNLFACHQENVQPDFLCLAKGLTGGYLPMAATLTTQKIFDAFLGEYHEFKTFFHGHSYTGNQLGAAAALASLEILQSEKSIRARQKLETVLRDELEHSGNCPTSATSGRPA